MYENVCGIRANGAMFEESTTLKFFKKNNKTPKRISIVYGKNGSGKSTISRAFLKCKHYEDSELIESDLIDFDGNIIELSEEQKENIFVFNENYIEKNVRLCEDGLNTIVMFGEQVDLENKINSVGKVLEENKIEYESHELKYKKYEGSTDANSPGYHRLQIKNLLQRDDNWAGRERLIKELRRNASVNDVIIEKIRLLSPKRPESDILTEYEKKFMELQKFSSGAVRIADRVVDVNLDFDENLLFELLSKKIEKPVLSIRDQYIMDLVLKGKQEHFKEVKVTFSNPNIVTCPYCLQPVSDDYKIELVDSIQKVLNKNVDEHIENLIKMKIPKIEITFDKYDALDASQVKKCKDCLEAVNSVIISYNDLIDTKTENSYIPIEASSMNLRALIDGLNSELKILESLRLDHNSKFEQIDKIKEALSALNEELAYFTVKEHNDQYIKLSNERDGEKQKLSIIKTKMECKKNNYNELIRQKKSVKIAVDYINRGLRYVFLSKKRLEIKIDGDKYTLISNGRAVKPSNISCGERNAIALCYFFTELMNNLKETDIYSNEILLVIDDPVSSFDLENKVGILSYLKAQLLRVLLGNENSKVIVMSHDLSSINDINKAIKEIKDAAKIKFSRDVTDFLLLELVDMNLTDLPYSRNEYNQLLKLIYDYGSGNSLNNDLVIGNVMRRVLEAFSTFEFRKSIEAVSCDQELLASMGDQKYSEYFESLMYRLVLHGESHMEDRIKNLHDFNLFYTMSEVDKMRTAKDVLCLINVLNKQHIKAHFRDRPDEIEVINSWCNDIISN